MPNVTLRMKEPNAFPAIPIEADNISPDKFTNKNLSDIADLPIWRGNKEITLSSLFAITGDDFLGNEVDKITIFMSGDLSKVKRIGQSMSGGSIIINSSIGMHLGFQMKGGIITLNGDADDFAGANMEGGKLIINGNAGHYLGGSVRGDWRGMSGGIITVSGNVMNECGVWMRNGIIEIQGNSEMFLGMHMHNGTILLHGNATERVGAEMTGGIIVIRGKLQKSLPSFEFQGIKTNLKFEGYGAIEGTFLEFKGDYAERKQGTMYLLKERNQHLF